MSNDNVDTDVSEDCWIHFQGLKQSLFLNCLDSEDVGGEIFQNIDSYYQLGLG
jgi:hypothetical protein